MRLIWSPRSRNDLRAIARWIAKDDPNAAIGAIRRIREAAALLADRPYVGRPGRVPGTRELVITATHYIVPYRVDGERVEIIAVLHSSRLWPNRF